MIFANGINKDDTYGLCDVFGRDKIFYKDTTVRIQGWETTASVFYVRDGRLRIRFKKALESFFNAYEDAPFDGDPTFVFYNKLLEDYQAKELFRRMDYAVEQFKKAKKPFSVTTLSPEELGERLRDDSLFVGPEFSFDDGMGASDFYDVSCFFFPVDIDAFVTDLVNRSSFSHDEAELVYWNGRAVHGHVGYDGRFYCTDLFFGRNGQPEVFAIEEGVRKLPPEQWLCRHGVGFGYTFLRRYVVCPDCSCYSYSGEPLEECTKHHRNVKWLNELIRLLRKDHPRGYFHEPYLQIVVPREFTTFDIASVEAVVVPHLKTKGALNETAWSHFKMVQKLVEEVGLSTDFECAVRNVLDLNKSQMYGGSRRNICSERLYAHLCALHRQVGSERMAFLLTNAVNLKTAVAAINGKQVVELCVSDDVLRAIRLERKVPKELKECEEWMALRAGVLVVFVNAANEKFCAVTTDTKSGLSCHRV